MGRRLLVVEDDAALARVLCDSLTAEGFDVSWAVDGAAAARRFAEDAPDLVVVDTTSLGADEGSGAWLSGGRRPPLVLLTSRGVGDDAAWQWMRAEDHVSKPFRVDDLVARIRALLRGASSAVRRVTFGRVVVDFMARRAGSPERPLHLSRREFDLLQYLAERQPESVTLVELLREVWGSGEPGLTHVAERAVARLRQQIEPDPSRPRFLLADGTGLRLTSSTTWRILAGDRPSPR